MCRRSRWDWLVVNEAIRSNNVKRKMLEMNGWWVDVPWAILLTMLWQKKRKMQSINRV
jgi:hypothetical protein